MIAFIDFKARDDCENLENSYGEICVKCNRCGRFNKPMPTNSPGIKIECWNKSGCIHNSNNSPKFMKCRCEGYSVEQCGVENSENVK